MVRGKPRPVTDAGTTRSPQPVRIALTLSSAASLGAFQAGAVAALLVAVQSASQREAPAGEGPVLRVDAIGTTSAGALVGLLAARCLQGGLDPVHVLHEAWVQQADWRRLRSPDGAAPLSLDQVEHSLRHLLAARDGRGRRVGSAPRQSVPLVLRIAVGSLRALTRPLPRPGAGPLATLTHVDGSMFVLRPGDGPEAFTEPPRRSPLDLTLASMSHPAVFPPRVLDRRGPEADHHALGVTDLPDDGLVWCTDGSALLGDPLTRTLAAARSAETLGGPPGRRMHVLVHPHTAGPAGDGRWAGSGERPGWSRTAARLVACLTPQAVHDDLRAVADTDVRVRRVAELVAAVAPHLPDDAAPALRRFLGGADGTVPDLLASAVADVAGLTGVREVDLEVVSPVRLLGSDPDSQADVRDLLAGDGLGRFGGFLHRGRRGRDFAIGWRSARAWLPDALERAGLPADAVAATVAAVDARAVDEPVLRADHDGHDAGPTAAGGARLPVRDRLLLARTALRTALVALLGAVRS